MKKRLLSFVMAFLMAFSCFPSESFAAEYITKEIDGKTKYYEYKEKTVTVSTENHYDVWHTSDGKWKIGFSVKILRTPAIATI